ncbi:sulfatase family protein [Nocardioides pyridinolyticus]
MAKAHRPAGLVVLVVLSLLLLSGGPVGRATPAAPGGEDRQRRPNIVVVIADDMRVGDLRFAPRIRALVGRHGLTFRNSFSSYPLCCPARASLLTGTYAHNHRVWWHGAPFGYAAFDDRRTIATSLTAVGYRTGLIGKYLNGYGPMRSRVTGRPSSRYVPRGWSDWRASLDEGVPGVHGGTGHYFDMPFNVNGRVDNSHRGQYSTTVIGNMAVAMAGRFARESRPFFMYVNYFAPHFGAPWEAGDPPAFVADRTGVRRDFRTPARPRWVQGRFDRVITHSAGLPRDGGPAERDVSDKPRWIREIPEVSARERAWMRDTTRQRAEAVYVMDRQVARLIGRLKDTGAWGDTVFIFTSDNGYYLGEHRHRAGKVFAHEPSLRVPFLVTGPGMRSGGNRYDPISSIDVTATILDLARAAPPRRPDGMSRVPTMLEGDQGWSTAVVTESALPGGRRPVPLFNDRRTAIGLRTARYSYTVNRAGLDELYDLAVDPLQNHNKIEAPSYRPARRLLHDVWVQLRNCRGRECRAALPEDLSASAAQARALTRRYWRAVDAEYGWR